MTQQIRLNQTITELAPNIEGLIPQDTLERLRAVLIELTVSFKDVPDDERHALLTSLCDREVLRLTYCQSKRTKAEAHRRIKGSRQTLSKRLNLYGINKHTVSLEDCLAVNRAIAYKENS